MPPIIVQIIGGTTVWQQAGGGVFLFGENGILLIDKSLMMEDAVMTAAPSEKVKLNKKIAKLKDQALEIAQFEEKIHHLADQMIAIDLDDGVKVNYAKFEAVLEKIK